MLRLISKVIISIVLLAEIRPDYGFTDTCQTSVPESIISYLEADSYTSAIRNAISLGGDADTMACMAGGIAVATKGMEIPEELARCVYNNVLDDNLRQILDEFNRGVLNAESCWHHCQQDSLSKTEPKSLPCNFYLCNIYCNLNKSNYL